MAHPHKAHPHKAHPHKAVKIATRLTPLWLSLIAIALILQPGPLFAQEDSLCYWESSQGQTVDLSSLCGQAPTKTTSLQTYSPSVQQAVNQYIQQNKESFIAQATTTCRTLRYGGPAAAATRRQALIAYQGGSETMKARQEAVDAYAIANYCPDLQ